MSSSQCDISNSDFVFSYCPSYAAAVVFAVLFSLTSAGHIYQAWQLRKTFAWVLIMGGVWEIVGYAIRTASIRSPYASGLYIAQMLLILLAPLWINALIYMLVGRMIHFFLDDDRIFGFKARKIAMVFVAFDIIAFFVQGTGGSMSSSTDINAVLTGLNVYTAGVALQIAFNAVFLAIVGRFHITAVSVLKLPSASSQQLHQRSFKDCLHLLYLVYGIIALILFRNFYRLAEFASGLNNTIIKHEWYAYVFDAVPMFAAMVILNAFHPGQKLQGDRCDFTEENKTRKEAKRQKKMAKQQEEMKNRLVTKEPEVFSREVVGDNLV